MPLKKWNVQFVKVRLCVLQVEAVQKNMVLLSGVDLVDATVSFHCFYLLATLVLLYGFIWYNLDLYASKCDVDDLNHIVKLIV